MKKLLILLIIFTACGGSGSDNSTEPSPSTTSANTTVGNPRSDGLAATAGKRVDRAGPGIEHF